MTLLPITKRTTYCFKDCGKDICSCKPYEPISDTITTIQLSSAIQVPNKVIMSKIRSLCLPYTIDQYTDKKGEKRDCYSIPIHHIPNLIRSFKTLTGEQTANLLLLFTEKAR